MTKVYGKCHEEIGAFNDTKYIVGMLDRVRLVVGGWVAQWSEHSPFTSEVAGSILSKIVLDVN